MLSLRFPLACFFSLAFSTLMGEAQAQSIQDAIRIQAGKSGSGISSWYRARNYTPVWSGESLSGLAQFLHSLDAHGLSPALFQFAAWDAQWRAPSADPAKRAAVEVGTTQLALHAIQSVAYGFVDPRQVHPKWAEIPRQVTSYQFLDQALQKPPSQFAGHLLQSAPPQDTRYLELVKTLARYRDLSRSGGWRSLPATATPAGPGTKYSALNLLTSRLQSEGDLPGGATNNLKGKIDNRTGEAIKSFQFRHGIEPDGFLGAETLTELNTPVAHRVNELIINLDRLRWMPRTWDVPEHIEVNIAEGALRIYANQRETAVMKVVVGMKSVSETPVFHGKVQDVYFRPTWNVPTSIARRKLIPAALSAPEGPDGYMRSNNYQIITSYGSSATLPNTVDNLNKVASGGLLMRQGGGPDNSLGLIKFIFPNDSAVYLHDTNHPELFGRADRDYSSGCVRVERPVDLAMFILRHNPGWNPQSIRATMDDPRVNDRRETLKKTTSVYLNYWTCTIMGDRRVRFDRDIYGHDNTMFQKFGLQTQALPAAATQAAR
ncbi:MAG TPA: L,D-transpeptidase family protein [Verrucomicrobiales bacterium]|jgi:murein L,D-transpeptidase YcbB/YkuD|nr:L,D-transpeptidase family protein [Verrucomicrobiales bacterium]